ncbi:zinc-finger homeodomain protein 3-like [Lycium ferocissimum]|uniref:zinc-finger homeodomain protein 3-like n=1 Tax=Lycium ferocissimum TaxID=112874 RepID=UPI0028151CB0|nr:zinc-finger homeodomain protein 3-like [Lycium ferocissimum]
MANMLRANQAAKANRSLSSIVYGECTQNLLSSSVRYITDGCEAFAPGDPSGSIEALHCRFCNCHQNFYRRLNAGNHQPPPPPQSSSFDSGLVYSAPNLEQATQAEVNMEESNTNADNSVAESSFVPIRQTYDNTGNGKKLWDELCAEDDEKDQLDLTLNMGGNNNKNKHTYAEDLCCCYCLWFCCFCFMYLFERLITEDLV